MAAPCDACVFFADEENSLNERVQMAVKLGYSSIMINNVVEDIMGSSKAKGKKTKAKACAIQHPKEIRLQGSEIEQLKPFMQGKGRELQQYTRLTAILTDVAEVIRLRKDETIQKYDILAVQPTTEKLFQIACQTLDVDLITFDMTQKMPFYLKRTFIGVALDRGIHFEICYSPMIADESARRNTISAAQSLVGLCKGKNIIISSGAKKTMHLRGPYDVTALGMLFSLTEAQAKDAVTSNCWSLIMHSKSRKSAKGVLTMTRKTELTPGEQWKVREDVEPEEEEEEEEDGDGEGEEEEEEVMEQEQGKTEAKQKDSEQGPAEETGEPPLKKPRTDVTS